jgi:predicted nucleic acid-binding protein
LSDGQVLTHPFVSGELACGNLKDRESILSGLNALPAAHMASHAEVMQLLDSRRFWGRGLGWIDMHLLASALLSRCQLWTLDKRLAEAAIELGVAD